ncbi:hypothetical protein SeMB42_g07998 [Synchytrium endobioticum]|uniref:Uncharacterized protein n=1 Tax=Synchytrium endobioticum TaxID=286115 RepID=A0A507C0Y8_9FUNG|nr:hypothetical protein SeMB42_g07998 [Synchytrium endobioticum]TPX35190.1 hypothetical protein SeLEV6574_g08203 [Synchytrium endobioticum]
MCWFLDAKSMVSAAVRLNVMGTHQGQPILMDVQPHVSNNLVKRFPNIPCLDQRSMVNLAPTIEHLEIGKRHAMSRTVPSDERYRNVMESVFVLRGVVEMSGVR